MVMSAENRALCYFYRHPPPHSGAQPVRAARVECRRCHPSHTPRGEALRAWLEEGPENAWPQSGLAEEK